MNLISFLIVILIKKILYIIATFLKYYKEGHYNLNNFNTIEKLNIIVNPWTPEYIKTVIYFIQQRKGDI